MTDDAYLFLTDDTAATTLGVPPSTAGDPAFLETPAVRAWLDAHGVSATSPRLRLVPPEETAAIPEDAERLPVPLSEEELNRLRLQEAPEPHARLEEELLAYRECSDGRDALLGRAVAAGVPVERIVELTGEDPAVVAAVAR
ncbi:DUF6003 family protein [Streptomyces fradiae]|uniref:DUF6003 family protein n=1 Tax=Streptomyces fradiae TaxID=1906 RepID=UPI002942A831|nr:DUF6003 family protein [Streptomyces fradiae]WOI60832.1 DUF6003 family protein [Streptomyces fradiae]